MGSRVDHWITRWKIESPKEFINMLHHFCVWRHWGKQTVTQYILNIEVLIRRYLPKKTERTLTWVHGLMMQYLTLGLRYYGIYPWDLGIAHISHMHRGERILRMKWLALTKLSCFLKMSLDTKIWLKSMWGLRSPERTTSYHAQDLQNSRGTCWNTSHPADLYINISFINKLYM